MVLLSTLRLMGWRYYKLKLGFAKKIYLKKPFFFHLTILKLCFFLLKQLQRAQFPHKSSYHCSSSYSTSTSSRTYYTVTTGGNLSTGSSNSLRIGWDSPNSWDPSACPRHKGKLSASTRPSSEDCLSGSSTIGALLPRNGQQVEWVSSSESTTATNIVRLTYHLIFCDWVD